MQNKKSILYLLSGINILLNSLMTVIRSANKDIVLNIVLIIFSTILANLVSIKENSSAEYYGVLFITLVSFMVLANRLILIPVWINWIAAIFLYAGISLLLIVILTIKRKK